MQLAYVMKSERGETDRLLFSVAEALKAKGLRTAGIVQTNTDCEGSVHCDMDVQVLPEGQVIRISQSLGEGSRGCRLNPEALEQAVAQVAETLSAAPAPQVLLVNKFGKHEAHGRGMRPLIGEALAAGIPVVCGVNALNVEAFERFAEGIETRVDPELDALMAWVEQALEAG